jgi:hypothetical protein
VVTALALLIPIGILGGLAALVYFLVRGGAGDDTFSSRTLLRAYLRFAYFASLVVFLVGAVSTLTAGFGAAFGHDFSYQPRFNPAAPCPPPPPGADANAQGSYNQCLKVNNGQPPNTPADTSQQDDLIRGISLLVTGLVLGLGHRLGQRAVETRAEARDSGLARTEALLGTVGFGLVSLVALPVAAYSVLHHVILGAPVPNGGSSDMLGPALAMAIVFLPAWLYHLSGFVRRARRAPAATSIEPAV